MHNVLVEAAVIKVKSIVILGVAYYIKKQVIFFYINLLLNSFKLFSIGYKMIFFIHFLSFFCTVTMLCNHKMISIEQKPLFFASIKKV